MIFLQIIAYDIILDDPRCKKICILPEIAVLKKLRTKGKDLLKNWKRAFAWDKLDEKFMNFTSPVTRNPFSHMNIQSFPSTGFRCIQFVQLLDSTCSVHRNGIKTTMIPLETKRAFRATRTWQVFFTTLVAESFLSEFNCCFFYRLGYTKMKRDFSILTRNKNKNGSFFVETCAN